MGLTRDDILKAQDLPTAVVDVPEWGGQVTLRGFSAAARDNLAKRGTDENGGVEISNAEFLALCLVDDEGAPLFAPEDADTTLGRKNPRSDRPAVAGSHPAQRSARRAVEEAEKNS
nr:hypothetical protein [Nitratidesulfovibrio sp. HK-II]GBO98277.1 hypothetical protein RVX_3316 [Nitratidesulfovibrio sp. HK-II]